MADKAKRKRPPGPDSEVPRSTPSNVAVARGPLSFVAVKAKRIRPPSPDSDVFRPTPSNVAIDRALSSVVAVKTYDVPGDMADGWQYASYFKFSFCGNGIIIESEDAGDDSYLITILAPAMLFKRTNGIKPQEVKFDVRVSGGKLYKGEVLCCDFHYNIAAIRIKSKSPLEPAALRALNDVPVIDTDVHEHPQSHGKNTFQIGRHSNLFKVQPGTKIISLKKSFSSQFPYSATCGVFSANHLFSYDCKELYWVKSDSCVNSGAVINLFGEVMGILFCQFAFLPSNFILRWWDHYKSNGNFCRPWVGVEVGNLAEARLIILEQFTNTFSDKGIGTGVIVTKVDKDSPAYRSGIMLKDVIVKCNGKRVKSKIKFFERMWENTGNPVELTVLRSSDGQKLKLSMSIEETTPPNFYKWMRPEIRSYVE